mmetsp:Transcript_94285/g.224506  ORF Transcript_94285/g.224506 Transcript_94285/m.224506 type:complete len:218 (+) Transcript_94285:257-910(+)
MHDLVQLLGRLSLQCRWLFAQSQDFIVGRLCDIGCIVFSRIVLQPRERLERWILRDEEIGRTLHVPQITVVCLDLDVDILPSVSASVHSFEEVHCLKRVLINHVDLTLDTRAIASLVKKLRSTGAVCGCIGRAHNHRKALQCQSVCYECCLRVGFCNAQVPGIVRKTSLQGAVDKECNVSVHGRLDTHDVGKVATCGIWSEVGCSPGKRCQARPARA